MRVRVLNAARTTVFANVVANINRYNCKVEVGGALLCPVAVMVPLGADTFDVTAYDQIDGKGRVLSALADFPFTVLTGKSNRIDMTLDGVVSKVGVRLVGNSYLATGDDQKGFQFAGEGSRAAQQVQLYAEDADGNAIAGSVTSGTFDLVTASTAKVTVDAVPGMPGRFKLTPLAETTAASSPDLSTAIGLTAKLARTSGVTLTKSFALQLEPVAYCSNSQGEVMPITPWLADSVTLPPGTIDMGSSAGSYEPMAIDAGGNLYVGWSNIGEVTEYPLGSTIPSRTITGLANVGDAFTAGTMAVDASGDLYTVAEGVINEYSPSGGNTPVRSLSLESQGIDVPRGIAVDAAGNLYVGNIGKTHAVSVFPADTSATTPSFSLGTAADGPAWVSFDASGNLYVSNQFAQRVDEYEAPITSSSTVYKTFGSSSTFTGEPLVASIDANGNVYAANFGAAPAVVQEFATDAPGIVARSLPGVYLSAPLDQLGNVFVEGAFDLAVYPPGASYEDLFDRYGISYANNVVIWP